MFHPKFGRRPLLRMTEDETGGGGGVAPAPSHSFLDLGGGDPPAPQAPATLPPANEWDSLPKSWTKDLEPHWKAAPAEVRQFAHRREADVEKGIRTYADGHGRWTKLQSVFAEVAQQHPDLDIAGLYENLAQNHLALVKADPQTRRAYFQRMAQHYGIDGLGEQAPAAAPGGQPPAGGQPFTAEQMAALEQLLGPVFGTVRQYQASQQQAHAEKVGKEVDAFFSDPKNKYAADVAPVMAAIIKSGVTRNVAEAYELAVMRTPEVRAKYLADLAGATSPAPQPPNVKSSAAPASPGKPGTIDDTMKEIIRKHYG